MTKLKFRQGGENHNIGLATVKPQGKALAICHNGQVLRASVILAKSNLPHAGKILLGDDIFALAQEPVSFPNTGEYSCDVPNTGDVFTLSGLKTNLGMILIDGCHIKTLSGKIVGTFENNVITLFDAALPYDTGTVEITQGDYSLVIPAKENSSGSFVDVGGGTLEYNTSGIVDHYDFVSSTAYQFVDGTGGKTAFQITSLSSLITADNADNYIAVDETSGSMTFTASPGAVTLTANPLDYQINIAAGASGLYFTDSSRNGIINVNCSDITIDCGTGDNDTITYNGGDDVFIQNFGDDSKSKISLASDCQLFDVNGRTLIIGSAYTDETVGTITIGENQNDSVRVINGRNGERTVHVNDTVANTDFGIFNNDPTQATLVIIKTQCGDFGVIGGESNASATNGAEYYANLYTVEASRCNSFLVGNAKASRLIAKGGTKNVLTGGLGTDTFVFANGGGVIRDFGINAVYNGFQKYLAKNSSQGSTSTYAAFNRKDPTSYYAATDTLQVRGKVVEIAFDSFNNDSETYLYPHNVFTAYVTYISDFDGKAYTIALDNIVKKPTKYHSTDFTVHKFRLDSVAAKDLSIYEVDSKNNATKLDKDTELPLLFRSSNPADANESYYTAYRANIDALATFISDRSKVAITDDPPTALSTTYQQTYEEEFDRSKAVYAAGGVTDNTTIPPAT